MKDPAFLFYSQDFFTGVATLNWEERGKYITILCLMHQQGRMSEETIRFLVGSVSDNLKSKFSIDEKGLWYNARLEIEAEKRSKFTQSRRDNGSLGGRPKKGEKPSKKLKDNHKVNLMEDEIENEIEDRNTIPPTLESVRTYCQMRNKNVDPDKWHDFYTAKGWKVGKEKMRDWQAAVRTWETKATAEKQDARKFAL